MKKKGNKNRPSGEKIKQGKDQQLSDKKKNIKIRKEALKKIFNHFNNPGKKENHKP
ncbi:hypothetical protein [Lentimicrobium sp.]|uniref:hypothetical protein n=1 Tax=Lentimicrobium sp. TaxID=2034841 RepID=UPI002D106033|nr:hypothetical protein [Lentimicrobium sp.]HPR25059.1 hypothetical protein [Lentimicrobium sp.]HRW67945.1 hypothetical protein [Lentimicrobium sp.]